MHWLGWAPNTPLNLPRENGSSWRNPAEFAFRNEEVELLESWIDPIELGSSESEFGDARGALVRYHLPDYWCNIASHLSEHLRNVSEIMAASTEWYGRNSQYPSLAILPVTVNNGTLRSLQSSVEEAERRVRGTRLIVRSQLRWLSWFIAVNHVWDQSLDYKDADFVNLLRLPLRKKRGYLFNLSRDYHEANFRFLLANEVPFHYAWTKAEEETGRFLRCNPQYLSEYEELASRGPVDATGLPLYRLWEEDLKRYNIFFQDARSGRMGFVVTGFQPHWDCKMIDYVYYGAQPIDSRSERRACAERFRGRLITAKFEDGSSQTTCTFFRQNPIQRNSSIKELCMPVQHQYRLSDFGSEIGAIEKDEHAYFYEDPSIVREQWRTRCAPRPDRSFNTFSGREAKESAAIPPAPSGSKTAASGPGQGSSLTRVGTNHSRPRRSLVPMSPTRRSGGSADAGVTSRWTRINTDVVSPRRRTSRSISPRDQEGWRNQRDQRGRSPLRREPSIHGEDDTRRSRSLSSHSSSSYSSPFEDEYQLALGVIYLNTSESGNSDFLTRDAAIDKLTRWTSTVLGPIEHSTLGELSLWNLDWLRCSKIVGGHQSSLLLLKYVAAIGNFTDATEVLNAAIRHGIPFQIFVLQTQVRHVWVPSTMSAMEARSLSAMYAPGYMEIPLDYGTGGASCYTRYLRQVEELLRRPHAPALIALGGAVSFIVQAYETDLVSRFCQGPSLQTSRFGSGAVRLDTYEGVESLYTADQISDGEIAVLCGHISRGNHLTDAYLWPQPRWIYKISEHWTGGWSTIFLSFMENLRASIMDRKNYRWRTEREWRSYIRNGNRGGFTSDMARDSVLKEGNRLMNKSFPIDWEGAAIMDLVLPEVYDRGAL
ncbi:hypothetical protein K438DRAFT_2034276 [Mycena galopus ATCC 62051]|nr:hypothetical protein K438DRAFT_2034276 [Mycena galopus ATCC 62051]